MIVSAVALVAAAVPASAAADGNLTSGSVGSTQVSSVSVGPEVSAPDGTTVTVPVAVVGDGGNASNGAIGTAQVGGGNSSTGSIGTAQASSVQGRPSVKTDASVVHASAAVPATLPGSGSNDSNGSIGTAQVGGGHSTSDSLVQVQANKPSATPSASAGTDSGTLVNVGSPEQPTLVLLLGPPQPREKVAAALTHDFAFDPANLLFQATALGVNPDVLAAVDPIAALTFGGVIGTGPNGGNSAPDSPGTAQVGSVTLAPAIGLDSAALGTSGSVGGSSGVTGVGSNFADPSYGTVQAGGGNTASDSDGSVQIGSLFLAPAGTLATPYGTAGLGGSSGIAGGSNSSSGSIGTVQVGGGNSSNGSAGTAQLGTVSVGPTAQSSGTPNGAGDASLGGSSGIAGSGNNANGSLGTAQVGGGNGATGSRGTAQSSGITFGQRLTAAGVSIAAPTTIGRGSGNSADGSTGVAQVGGGNSATDSIGTTQIGSGTPAAGSPPGPTARSLSSATPTALAAPTRTRARAASPPAASGVNPATHTKAGSKPAQGELGANRSLLNGTLPFTGLDLLYALIAGLLLTGAGRLVRRRAIA